MYWNARVQLEYEDDKGRQKKKNENYLVKAESPTDVEAIVYEKFAGYKGGFEVKAVSQSRILDVYEAGK